MIRLLAAICVSWLLCLPGTGASEDKLTVGGISVLSGEGSSWGVNQQRGSVLAVEEWNVKGGIRGKQIKLVFEDSPSGLARNAMSAYSKLVHGNGIKFILGPVAMDELLAVVPAAVKDGVFLGGATYMPNAPRNFFTTWIDADLESDRIAAEVLAKHKRIAILSSQQSWESQVARRFRETFIHAGGEITSFEEPSFEAAEVKSEVLRVKQTQPEALFISSYLLCSKYIKEIQRLGMQIPMFSIELDQAVIDNSGAAAEGLIFIAPTAPSDEFVKKFRQRWQANPEIPAASAYDAANLLFTAISDRGENVDDVSRYFEALRGYDGATGHIEKRDGRTVVSTSLYAVRHGMIQRMN